MPRALTHTKITQASTLMVPQVLNATSLFFFAFGITSIIYGEVYCNT